MKLQLFSDEMKTPDLHPITSKDVILKELAMERTQQKLQVYLIYIFCINRFTFKFEFISAKKFYCMK